MSLFHGVLLLLSLPSTTSVSLFPQLYVDNVRNQFLGSLIRSCDDPCESAVGYVADSNLNVLTLFDLTYNPLHVAVAHEKFPVVLAITRRVQELGMSVSDYVKIKVQDRKAMTPLILAARGDSFEIIRHLISAGAPIDDVDGDGKTALVHAVLVNKLRTIDLLLTLGADPSVPDGQGRSAQDYVNLHVHLADLTSFTESVASHNMMAQKINYLKSKEVSVDRPLPTDDEGKTPLMWAIALKQYRFVDLLLENGASLTRIDSDAMTAQDYVNWFSDLAKLVTLNDTVESTYNMVVGEIEYLKENGLSVDEPFPDDETRRTPLMWAVLSGRPRFVELLLRSGSDVNIRDSDGKTVFDHDRQSILASGEGGAAAPVSDEVMSKSPAFA